MRLLPNKDIIKAAMQYSTIRVHQLDKELRMLLMQGVVATHTLTLKYTAAGSRAEFCLHSK